MKNIYKINFVIGSNNEDEKIIYNIQRILIINPNYNYYNSNFFFFKLI